MIRFAIALLAVAMIGQSSFAQLLPNAPWNKATLVDSDGCTIDAVTGKKLFCPLKARRSQTPAAETTFEFRENVSYNDGPVQRSYSVASYAAPPSPVTVRSGGSCGTATARSFGSSGGGLAVGGRDSDGAVVTSIGSTVSPSIASVGTQSIAPLAIGDRIKFRQTLIAAARKAREAGDITPAQFFLLSAASRNPIALDKMQAAVHEAAIEDGLATPQAIDWDNLLSFIEKLIPIIIQLIGLFS